MGQNSDLTTFASKVQVLTRMEQRVNPMKMNFNNFKIKKLILQTVTAHKVEGKNGVICLASFFSS